MVQALSESKEYKVFSVFMRHDNWLSAKAELRAFGVCNPQAKVLVTDKDNDVYKDLFNKFKGIKKSLFGTDKVTDLENVEVLDKIQKEWKAKTVKESHKVVRANATSPVMMGCNIGKMLISQADLVKSRGKKEVALVYVQENRQEFRHEQAMTDRSGNVRFGGFSRDSVISKKRGNYWNR